MAVKRASQIRSFDAFAKPIDGVRTQTAAGGVITVLASTAAVILFISQLILYLQVDIRHSFSLAESNPLSIIFDANNLNLLKSKHSASHRSSDFTNVANALEKNRIKLSIHVTFLHIKCAELEFSHDDASLSNGKIVHIHGRAITKRVPTEYDWAKATGADPAGKSKHRQSFQTTAKNGCTIRGEITVPRIGGEFALTVTSSAWSNAMQRVQLGMFQGMMAGDNAFPQMHNVSHYIHDITFGDHFPLSGNPLSDVLDVVDNDSGVGLTNIAVKLIPTKYKRFARQTRETFQISMTKYFIQPETLAAQQSTQLPGIALQYDFTPLAVHHQETRENIFIFLGSLVSIVGGVFVTVGLVSTFLVNSAAAVAKKMD